MDTHQDLIAELILAEIEQRRESTPCQEYFPIKDGKYTRGLCSNCLWDGDSHVFEE